jgi:hypothetical protein
MLATILEDITIVFAYWDLVELSDNDDMASLVIVATKSLQLLLYWRCKLFTLVSPLEE